MVLGEYPLLNALMHRPLGSRDLDREIYV